MRRILLLLAVALLAVRVSAVADKPAGAPSPEIRSVRFCSPRLSVSRAKNANVAYVRGPLRVDMSFARAYARRPLLRVTCLCDVEGVLVVYTALLDKPGSNERMDRGAAAEVFRAAGVTLALKEREEALRDPARLTPLLSEVTRERFAAATYGTADIDRGFFRITGTTRPPHLLTFRLELWQNGACVGSYEAPRTGLGPYQLPDDWHAWRKHPDRFQYAP